MKSSSLISLLISDLGLEVWRSLFIPNSALHYMECRAALNLTWFRAHSAFRRLGYR